MTIRELMVELDNLTEEKPELLDWQCFANMWGDAGQIRINFSDKKDKYVVLEN